MYDAIVFDNDGVLTEPTNRNVLRRAIRDAFDAAGVPDPPTGDVKSLHGTTAADVRRICADHGIDPGSFWRRREAEATRRQTKAIRRGEKPLYDDVRQILDLDTDIGIVSNNQHETIEFIVEHFDLAPSVATYYGRERSVAGMERKKPDPHYLRQALADLETEDALYVGDSQKDIVAARRAGIDSAFVRRAHRADLDLNPRPTHEVTDLRELRALLETEAATFDTDPPE
jgi:phosphoglycolate phosphatase-like HAD superfamily hydrolase